MMRALSTQPGMELPLRTRPGKADFARIPLLIQGGYYVASGIWPLLNMRSFERVTGPKTDKWLVKTVGILVTAIGASLLLASKRKTVSPEGRLLAAGTGAALALIDVTYVAKRRIARVYLLDAFAEAALLLGLLLAGNSSRKE